MGHQVTMLARDSNMRAREMVYTTIHVLVQLIRISRGN
jgi:hypothetical protein